MGPCWAPVGPSWAPVGPWLGLTGAQLGMLLGTSSEDVVRMTSDHLVLVGIPDHKTFTAKVLGDHTWEGSVTSPREVPVVTESPS